MTLTYCPQCLRMTEHDGQERCIVCRDRAIAERADRTGHIFPRRRHAIGFDAFFPNMPELAFA